MTHTTDSVVMFCLAGSLRCTICSSNASSVPRREHWKLLSSLKTTVEGLVSTTNPNVWSRYGGLERLHKDMNHILSHGLKNEQVGPPLQHSLRPGPEDTKRKDSSRRWWWQWWLLLLLLSRLPHTALEMFHNPHIAWAFNKGMPFQLTNVLGENVDKCYVICLHAQKSLGTCS